MGKDRTSGERRKFDRFAVKIPVNCKTVSPERKHTGRGLVHTTTKNISSNGILLKWPGEYRLPEFLKLGISVIPTSKPIESIAWTVWTKEKSRRGKGKTELPNQYDVGLSFVENEYSKIPRLISRETDFYWEIFEKTGHIQAYLLHKGVRKECEEISKDG
ncbi:MAG TPA: PilZ domain-containing protein [bacterium]|nr:PilZ domain-containing protein [bacterium]